MIAGLLKDLGTSKLIALGVGLIILLSGIIFLSLKLSTPAFSPLYTNLTLEDGADIIEKLEGMGVKYELRANGTQVLVPAAQVHRLRMSMAKDGLPSSGSVVGYEVFDQAESLGTSNFVYNVNLKRALEGELARTIGTFANVEKARVHLVIPKRELFSKNAQEPTASVVLDLKKGSLDQAEIEAISHLVATAVPNLKPSKITIVDTQGKPLKLGAGDENDPGYYASTTDQFRQNYEHKLKTTVTQLLEQIVGNGRVQVEISADIDFDRIETKSEIYDPEGQVVRSVQTIEESESLRDQERNSNVSVANNQPDAEAGGGTVGRSNNTQRVDETTNFEISKTIKSHIKEIGNVKKLSVAVLVDGIYNLEDGDFSYTPRPEDELQRLETLVKSAIGFDEDRGDVVEVVNMQFSTGFEGPEQEKPYDWVKRELGSILQTLIIGIVVILVILLVIKPMLNRAFEITKAEAEEASLGDAFAGVDPLAELAAHDEEDEDSIDIEQVEARVKSSSIKTINEIIEKHPSEALTIFRSWLYDQKEEK